MKNSNCKKTFLFAILLLSFGFSNFAQELVHPGLSHKKSDLDRMKYMVEAKIEPFYSSYQHMCELPTAKYNYTVQGDVSIKTYGLDPYGWKDARFNADARAAYYGALRWYVERDERYAEKAIEAIMAWSGLTNHPGMSLKTAPIWLMIEAAEIIRYTYDGWAEADIKKFEDMLVYPGYSTTKAPNGNKTWYWNAYLFDEARAGNQELCGVRTVAAIGVFLDNKIIYDRAMRYVSGLPAREDDLPGARGPRIRGPINEAGSTPYSISYTVPYPENTNNYPDWGYCGVLKYNIYPNGQNVESSRDQAHTSFSLGLLNTLGEIGWSQGDDLFSMYDSRILTGCEYTLRYCVSSVKSFSDQTTPWEPETFIDLDELGLEEPRLEDASYDFIQITNRTKRNKSQTMSPDSRDGFPQYNTWELPIAHYVGRGFKTKEDAKWTIRARDYARQVNGTYEPASTGQDYTGYGALLYHRPEGCMGDPISGFTASGLPVYDMNVLPCVIEAENYDYNPVYEEGRIYHDMDSLNTKGFYRTDQGVDIDTCAEGGYQLSSLEDGEWLTYTIAVREAGYYDVNFRYAAANADGKVKIVFANQHETEEVSIPFGGGYSTGLDNYSHFTVAEKVLLQAGVMAMKVQVSGVSNSFVLNSISVDRNTMFTHIEAEDYTNMSGVSVAETTDEEGAYQVQSIRPDDWMTYDVYLPYTQNYNLEFRMSAALDGQYVVELDGEVIDTFSYTATGGTDVWETLSSAVSLPLRAGNHTLKITAQATGSYLNWIDFSRDESTCDVTEILPIFSIYNPGGIEIGTVQTDSIDVIPGYTVQLAPNPEEGGMWSWTGPDDFTSDERVLIFNSVQENNSGNYVVTFTNDCGVSTTDTFGINVSSSLFIEAESFSDMSGVTTAATTDEGGGFVVNGIEADDFMEYEINIPYTGSYLLDYRVSGANAGGFMVSLDGVELETISFEATGSDETWTTVSSAAPLNLSEGVQTLKITAKSAGWNINWLQLNLEDLLLPCALPFEVDELSFIDQETEWSSGVIDLSCTESVNLFMNVEGMGSLGVSDYLNIYYKLDGGDEVAILENTGELTFSKIAEPGLQGETIEIIIRASTSSSDKIFKITGLKISEPPVFNRIEAEDFFTMFGIQTQATSDVNGNENVGWVHNGDWLMYKDIDLTGANSFNVRYSSPGTGNRIEMHLDSVNGPLIGNLKLNQTGNWNTWRTQGANIIPTDGIYDVYLVLKGGDGYLFNLNWFQYSSVELNISKDASITSSVYQVNQESLTIGIPKATILVLFTPNITPAAGASFEVFKEDGITPATYVTEGFKVIVTALDGITKAVYTIDFVSSVSKLKNQIEAVHPNPAKDKLFIQTVNDGAKIYRVCDVFGKSITQGVFTPGSANHELDITNWPKGVYMLRITGDQSSSTVKVIKE